MTAILKHIINLYESGEQTKAEDYCTRVSGEIPTQVYPLFPIKRERAIYSRDCQSEDKKDRGESECHWSPRWQILAPQPPLSALIGDLYYFPLKKHCPENVLEYIENILKNIEIY